MDIGIVMPVYNQIPAYLKSAIHSILNQTYQNFILTIVNDGANLETSKIIEEEAKNDSRVIIIKKEKNEGVAKALNSGFHYLKNFKTIKYYTWVSSDNIYYPTFLAELRETLVHSPSNVGFAYSSFRHIDKHGNPIGNINLKQFIQYQDQPKEKLLDVCFVGVSFMYKKEFAEKIEGYHMEPVEDYEYWLRLMETCDLVYLPKILMDYRQESPESISTKLKKSIHLHRQWRYSYNLARVQARNRRNIPPLLTIFFPIKHYTPEIEKKYEDLLEQTFSNYKVVIIDLSKNQYASKKLKHISDPRVAIFINQEKNDIQAVKKYIHVSDTPFTLLFGQGDFPSDTFVLDYLVKTFQKIKEKGMDINSYMVKDLGFGKITTSLCEQDILYGTIYSTEKFKQMLQVGNQNE